MQTVQLAHWLPYSPQVIFEFLTDPDSLAAVVGRIVRARVVERNDYRGKLAVTLDLPARKVIETVGDVQGEPGQWVSFKTHEPFPLEFTWRFAAQDGGTEVTSTLGFDLSVFGVPVAGMMVRGLITSELKEDMERLEKALAAHHAG